MLGSVSRIITAMHGDVMCEQRRYTRGVHAI